VPAVQTTRAPGRAVARAGVVVSTVNVLSFQLFASLSVPINMAAYLISNGAPPPKAEAAGDSDRAQWFGHFGFIVPWWYFAASGLVTLLVVLLATNPRWRFEPQTRKYFAFRTTPGFLAFVSFIMAGAQLGISTYYSDWTSNFDLYAIGTILSIVAIAIALLLHKFAPKTATPGNGGRGRRADDATDV
jgi:hypothetical protein